MLTVVVINRNSHHIAKLCNVNFIWSKSWDIEIRNHSQWFVWSCI